MKIQLSHKFEEIISIDNLLLAWKEFVVGKKSKPDVQIFARNLMDNILALHEDLANKTYAHGGYKSFFINDPKRRHIHKASVRDRLVHHAVYRILYPFFDRTFIGDSYSCRLEKGTHKAINCFRAVAYQVSKNHTKTCWVLKCDIKKFFASIDHQILIEILQEYIPDENIVWLLKNIIGSFRTDVECPPLQTRNPSERRMRRRGGVDCHRLDPLPLPLREGEKIGLPLGNLTSQLFANIYMNVFDQWVKHKLKARHYIRYADDFVFLSGDEIYLKNLIPMIRDFLSLRLRLTLHPDKIFLKTLASGVDFLGWVNFKDYRVLRNKTKHRMFSRIKENPTPETLQSYLGLLGHGDTFNVRERLLGEY